MAHCARCAVDLWSACCFQYWKQWLVTSLAKSLLSLHVRVKSSWNFELKPQKALGWHILNINFNKSLLRKYSTKHRGLGFIGLTVMETLVSMNAFWMDPSAPRMGSRAVCGGEGPPEWGRWPLMLLRGNFFGEGVPKASRGGSSIFRRVQDIQKEVKVL